MSRSTRRHKSPDQAYGGPGCGRLQMPRARSLLFCLLAVLVLSLMLGVYLSQDTTGGHEDRMPTLDLARDRVSHRPSKFSTAQIRALASQVDGSRLWETHLRPILTERLPGTRGSLAVQQHLSSRLSSLSADWAVDLDSFRSPTPRGQVRFTNVVATLDPSAPRRLLLACHYDSKALPPDPVAPGRVFLGASDSAVPCAMILELVTSLDIRLRDFKKQGPPLTLQLVFFDGEESFEEWTDTDSLYGSRHLAQRMANTPHPAGSAGANMLQALDLFVLLDLLGAADPLIVNHFQNTERWFDRLVAAEKRLHRQGLLTSHPSEQTYFRKDFYLGPVQDDHVPFLHKGVPVLHLISTPFPKVWHTLDDTEENLHRPTVLNLTKILALFVAEYLGL